MDVALGVEGPPHGAVGRVEGVQPVLRAADVDPSVDDGGGRVHHEIGLEAPVFGTRVRVERVDVAVVARGVHRVVDHRRRRGRRLAVGPELPQQLAVAAVERVHGEVVAADVNRSRGDRRGGQHPESRVVGPPRFTGVGVDGVYRLVGAADDHGVPGDGRGGPDPGVRPVAPHLGPGVGAQRAQRAVVAADVHRPVHHRRRRRDGHVGGGAPPRPHPVRRSGGRRGRPGSSRATAVHRPRVRVGGRVEIGRLRRRSRGIALDGVDVPPLTLRTDVARTQRRRAMAAFRADDRFGFVRLRGALSRSAGRGPAGAVVRVDVRRRLGRTAERPAASVRSSGSSVPSVTVSRVEERVSEGVAEGPEVRPVSGVARERSPERLVDRGRHVGQPARAIGSTVAALGQSARQQLVDHDAELVHVGVDADPVAIGGRPHLRRRVLRGDRPGVVAADAALRAARPVDEFRRVPRPVGRRGEPDVFGRDVVVSHPPTVSVCHGVGQRVRRPEPVSDVQIASALGQRSGV